MKGLIFVAAVCALVLGGSWALAAGPGLPGPKLTTHIVTAQENLGGPTGDFDQAVALCEPGEVVTGGGMEVASINPAVAVVTNGPTEDFESTGQQGWIVTLALDEPAPETPFTSFAICARGSKA